MQYISQAIFIFYYSYYYYFFLCSFESRYLREYNTIEGAKKGKRKLSLRAGFEPAREDPIGFQVQRLNHSAITAPDTFGKKFN